jgi:hypothetical protein
MAIRIGVIREYMDRKLFNEADSETIDITERAIAIFRSSAPPSSIRVPGGALLQKYIDRYAPSALNKLFISRFPTASPSIEGGKHRRSHRVARGHVPESVADAGA